VESVSEAFNCGVTTPMFFQLESETDKLHVSYLGGKGISLGVYTPTSQFRNGECRGFFPTFVGKIMFQTTYPTGELLAASRDS
jgi:hypothetical protein